MEKSGWSSRGYLPHFNDSIAVQHVCFRTNDSVAVSYKKYLKEEISSGRLNSSEISKRIHQHLDESTTSKLLTDKNAEIVENALLYHENQRYDLYAWAIMPNHVHVLLRVYPEYAIGKIISSWKSFSGRIISKMNPDYQFIQNKVWAREYWDRFMRDPIHFINTINYIHHNPVKSGLVLSSELWRWSSAFEDRYKERIKRILSDHSDE